MTPRQAAEALIFTGIAYIESDAGGSDGPWAELIAELTPRAGAVTAALPDGGDGIEQEVVDLVRLALQFVDQVTTTDLVAAAAMLDAQGVPMEGRTVMPPFLCVDTSKMELPTDEDLWRTKMPLMVMPPEYVEVAEVRDNPDDIGTYVEVHEILLAGTKLYARRS